MQVSKKKWYKISFFFLIGLLLIPPVVLGVNSGVPGANTTDAGADPIKMNLWIESEQSGVIEGGETAAGKEGSMVVLGYHHQMSSPAEGTIQHGLFRIVK